MLMQENIFIPLQMNNSYFVVPQEKFARLAKGRFGRFGSVDLATPNREHLGRGYKVPNGGVYSTPSDLSKFIGAELGFCWVLDANDHNIDWDYIFIIIIISLKYLEKNIILFGILNY